VSRFLGSLPGRRVAPRAPVLPGVSWPTRATGLMTPVERVDVPSRTDAARLRFLQAPAAAGRARRDGSLALFHSGGRDAGVDEVLRRVLASGRSLDQVEIICASRAYALVVWEKASRLDWPVTLSPGVPAAMTRPGRLLLRFGDWLASDVGAAELRQLIQSGDCAPRAFDERAAGEDAALSPGQAARLLLKAQATWGRETYAPALTRLAEEYDRRARDAEASGADQAWHARKAAQTRTLAAWVAGVIAATPAPDEAGHVAMDALADAAIAFLEDNATRGSAADAAAVVALTDALRQLRTLGPYRCGLDTAVTFLTACVEAVAVARDRPRPGHLHVSTLADAGLDGRALVFVVGLQEGAVFPAAVEDPVLLDEERRRLHPSLRTSADRVDDAVCVALARLAAIGLSAASVCLSVSCRDTRAFRETFPSWLLLQAFRVQQGNASLTYNDLGGQLGEPVSAVPAAPGQATTAAGWWLATCEATSAARPGILRAFPSLARGQQAERARDSNRFTEFDGLVPTAGPLLDPSRTGRPVSATTLEDAATCPYRFFLRQGLGVRPIEEAAAEPDAWLSPLTKGGELHDLFARLIRTLREEKRPPDLTKDLRRMRAWGDRRLAALRAELPPPSDEVFARERAEFLDDLEAFLTAECDGRHGRHPVGVEVGFGLPLDGDAREPLASPDPLVLDLDAKRRLRVHGRIDRVNRVAPGTYEVIDYKTGGYRPDDWQGVFAGGTRLQHALYGRAAEALLAAHGKDAAVVRGIYVFPAVKGHRRQKVIDAPTSATLKTVLRDLLDVIGTGAFAVSDGWQGCRYCEFAHACHADDPTAPANDEEVTRATKKVDNLANTVLDVLRELRRHA
jgi:ATP-dependent helicase/nuclease subunit B